MFTTPLGLEFRINIAPYYAVGTPKELAETSYSINAPLSLNEWRIPPHKFDNSETNSWACSYGLMENKGLRIFKVFFERGGKTTCLTFSSTPEDFSIGLPLFKKIAQSFTAL